MGLERIPTRADFEEEGIRGRTGAIEAGMEAIIAVGAASVEAEGMREEEEEALEGEDATGMAEDGLDIPF